MHVALSVVHYFCIAERTNILWNQNPARTSLVEESNANVSGLFVFKVNGLGGLEFPPVPPNIICKFLCIHFHRIIRVSILYENRYVCM